MFGVPGQLLNNSNNGRARSVFGQSAMPISYALAMFWRCFLCMRRDRVAVKRPETSSIICQETLSHDPIFSDL